MKVKLKFLLILFLLFSTPIIVKAACVDTDGGENKLVKGTCTTDGLFFTDHCIDGTHICELVCPDGGCACTLDTSCPPAHPNCIDGACVVAGPAMFTIKFENPLEYDDVEDIIDAIVDIILLIGIPIAILMILIAGFYFITSGGDPEKIKTAKRIIFWTIIGFTIILLAKGIIYLIKEVIGMS